MKTRGDVHYIFESYTEVGSEQRAGRPAIIVSNDKGNLTSKTIEIVYLTTAPKHECSTHVKIHSLLKPSTALCEQITSVSIDRVGDYIGTCTDVEMEMVNSAMLESLAIRRVYGSSKAATVSKDAERISELESQLKSALAEREMYKVMYETILDKIMGGRNG